MINEDYGLIKFDEKLIEDMKQINLEYEKLGYKPPYIFIDGEPCLADYRDFPKMENPYSYVKSLKEVKK